MLYHFIFKKISLLVHLPLVPYIYMGHWIGSSLVMKMVRCLFRDNPLFNPMITSYLSITPDKNRHKKKNQNQPGFIPLCPWGDVLIMTFAAVVLLCGDRFSDLRLSHGYSGLVGELLINLTCCFPDHPEMIKKERVVQCSKLLPVRQPEADNFGGGPATF